MSRVILILLLIISLAVHEANAKWFQQKTIYSKALGQEKTYYVGLPNGYDKDDPTKQYPVIIFLHGASVNATEMVNTIEPLLDNFFTRLFFANLFKVIFIIPDGSCEPFKGSFYTNSVLYGNYEDYVVHDLTEEIKQQYNTSNSRAKWAIMGHSMGGFGAMKIALKYPEKFIGVSSLSGPLHITHFDELLPIVLAEHGTAAPYNFSYSGSVSKLVYSMAGAFSPDLTNSPPVRFPINSNGKVNTTVLNSWEKFNPINLIRQWNGNPAMAIHQYCGDQDEFKLSRQNKLFSDTLSFYNLPHSYKPDPTGDHVNSLITSFPQGLNFLFQVMDTAKVRIVTKLDQETAFSSPEIFPNPAKNRFYVSNAEKVQRLTVFNLSGQAVLAASKADLQRGINIENLLKGMYIVRLESKNGKLTTCRLLKD